MAAARQAWSSLTTIDLRKPGDVDLVNRAVAAGWDVPQHIRDQICDQFDAALVSVNALKERDASRHLTRLLKLVKLMIKMEARNMIDEGHAKSSFPYLRRRRLDKRQRRCTVSVVERAARDREALRVALEKLARARAKSLNHSRPSVTAAKEVA